MSFKEKRGEAGTPIIRPLTTHKSIQAEQQSITAALVENSTFIKKTVKRF